MLNRLSILSKMTADKLLEKESRGCFDYFWNETNTDEKSPGYGLVRDRSPSNPEIASIAAVGFGLAACVIGAYRNYRSYDDIERRVLLTLDTLLDKAENVNGFFYHFLNKETAKRAYNCEVSIIDTAIAICGALTAGEYFQGKVRDKALQLYIQVDWSWFADDEKLQYHMGYFPENGFFNYWDEYAEQLMLYFLGAGSPNHSINPQMFYHFSRDRGYYKDIGPIIHSTSGSLFAYQFSHAFFDLRNKVDKQNIDWWQNSVEATEASRQYAIDSSDRFQTLHENAWGLTACDGPRGYCGGYGSPPRKIEKMFHSIHHDNDGTVPPCGPAGSIVFTAEYSKNALLYMYKNCAGLYGKYGFKDAYNNDGKKKWVAKDYLGIDKGISLLMIENYRSELIWKMFMKNTFVQQGIKVCGLSDKSLIPAKN